MPRATCGPRVRTYGPRVRYTTAVVKVVKTINKTITRTTKHARPSMPSQRPHFAPRPSPPRKSTGCPVASQLHDCAGGASGCTPAVDVLVGDAGETTDEASLRFCACGGGLTCGRRGLADTAGATDADADNATAIANAAIANTAIANCADDDANAVIANSAASANAAIANSAASANTNAYATADADAAIASALAHDVFDSQGRRFHGPALDGTNILRLVELAWFREECECTLRARLGHHDRDAFDLVSKYVLALKARYFRAHCLMLCGLHCHNQSPFPLTTWCRLVGLVIDAQHPPSRTQATVGGGGVYKRALSRFLRSLAPVAHPVNARKRLHRVCHSDIGIPAGRLVIDAAQVRKARVMHKKMQTSPQFCLQLGLQYRLGSI